MKLSQISRLLLDITNDKSSLVQVMTCCVTMKDKQVPVFHEHMQDEQFL